MLKVKVFLILAMSVIFDQEIKKSTHFSEIHLNWVEMEKVSQMSRVWAF